MTSPRRAASAAWLPKLRQQFGSALQENVSLRNYTTARVGGTVQALLPTNSTAELEKAVRALWSEDVPFWILGSGSNVLVSDQGLPGVVVLNHAHNVKIDARSPEPSVWAESGANFSAIARQVALRGLAGLEWAATIPGTLGGAVYGNAGAFGGDMQGNLGVAEILHRTGLEPFAQVENWTVEQMEYHYRSSILKREASANVILAARLRLTYSEMSAVRAKMSANAERRRQSQPPGASLGSMFKNPPGDYAGRLIEAAGLKGARIGDAEISLVHANFFINHGHASADDLRRLIQRARDTVYAQSGVWLELEVELLGDWSETEQKVGEA